MVESDYLNRQGAYRVDVTAPPRMLNSLMYKMCYYRSDRCRPASVGGRRQCARSAPAPSSHALTRSQRAALMGRLVRAQVVGPGLIAFEMPKSEINA